ncbi:TraX family protein [Lentilactobacillus diolivorans]|uniref:TraX protein n=2 Tax=Lentilactobacillus diolivorans TaxID=179838 RepID=A0A0R1SE74_9LACO|nr:TraX family protein [Lentilactobacillus diolivorans]KRL67424.1 TraX protein [Lentilactobacillus diolivorans DSM 14421]GEP24917.1 membrane protein [Lentilactobacillus diolivorans]
MLIEKVKKKGLTNFDIKVLGIVLMFIDHVHEMFATAGVPTWVDMFGRPVATIFMFLSVEGFTHTHNQKRYLFRLLIGFWVMGIGNLIVSHLFGGTDVFLANNIFCDLFLGVLTMYGIQTISSGLKRHQFLEILTGVLVIALPLIFSALLMEIMQGSLSAYLSYFMLGIPMPLTAENSFFLYLGPVMYLLRRHRGWQMIGIACAALISTGFNFTGLFTANTQWLMVLAVLPLSVYNGQLGKSMKGFFYGFYPIHIWGLYILAWLLGVGR